ncbi:MAG: hypothetical protein JSS75_11555 [Bacteroidetes bacterium]|nr:hypothetical protein [Bacteroidota bacterium]
MSKIAMIMKWDGISLEQYEEVRQIVKWEHDIPAGAIFHVATHDGSALRVVDVWESPEQFNRFVETRLMPGVMSTGITTQPQVEIYPAYAIFAPAFEGKLQTA